MRVSNTGKVGLKEDLLPNSISLPSYSAPLPLRPLNPTSTFPTRLLLPGCLYVSPFLLFAHTPKHTHVVWNDRRHIAGRGNAERVEERWGKKIGVD